MQAKLCQLFIRCFSEFQYGKLLNGSLDYRDEIRGEGAFKKFKVLVTIAIQYNKLLRMDLSKTCVRGVEHGETD